LTEYRDGRRDSALIGWDGFEAGNQADKINGNIH